MVEFAFFGYRTGMRSGPTCISPGGGNPFTFEVLGNNQNGDWLRDWSSIPEFDFRKMIRNASPRNILPVRLPAVS
jgi:hypothetical protein